MNIRIDEVEVEPQTVDEAKDAVERSRQRISTTLDELEDRIVEKKHAMQDRMDFLRPVRDRVVQRPFLAVAVAVGVGALLGSLGGGEEEEERDRPGSRPAEDEDGTSKLDALKHQLAGAVTSAIGAAVTARLREYTGGSDSTRRGGRVH